MRDIIYFIRQINSFSGPSLYMNIILMTLIGILEGFSVLLLISIISFTGFIVLNETESHYLNYFSFLENLSPNIMLPIILLIFLIVTIGINYLNRIITIKNAVIQNGFLRKLRVETYEALLLSSWPFFMKNRKSDLVNIILTEIGKSSAGTKAILSLFSSFLGTIFQLILAYLLSPNITIFILLLGIIFIYFNRRFLKNSHLLGTRNYELGKEFLAGVTDQINGFKDVKSNTLERSRIKWFHTITMKLENEQNSFAALKTTSQFYFKSASSIFIVIFIFFSIQFFQAQSSQLMLIIVIFFRLWPRVSGIQTSLETIATSMPSLKIVKNFQIECKNLAELNHNQFTNIEPLQLKHKIECRDVHFSYRLDETKETLSNINIVISSKKMTAFVGPSGAGKSTLIDLLMGLNKPTTGTVLIDGIPLTTENLLSLRSSLSYVPQDPFLFSTTIRENLLLVKENASEQELWAALEFASAAEFVKKFTNGMDTIIGDRGILLSGGERQRLVLARAILRKPSILVLDEATSALDTISEAKIQEALERLKGKMTILVIAHRLSTIQKADQIIVLNEGKVVQNGKFNKLNNEEDKLFSNLLGKQLQFK